MSNPNYSFQDDAVKSIAATFKDNSKAKTLLVIPTGGGKTRTAVKAILKLFEEEFFSNPNERILWVAHRNELQTQAAEAFEVESDHKFAKQAIEQTIIKSNVEGQKLILDDNIKLVIIDEAHHAKAPTYLPLFRPSVGVLGLTATPSRHDGQPLDFEDESYSIGFPDLVDRGVVLKPKIIELDGIKSDITGFKKNDLVKLNTPERNKSIAQAILDNQQKLNKIIVYVGAQQHAVDLCSALKQSELSQYYESISYVLGGEENSRNQPRAQFFEQEKKYKRSIIINVKVLTEGYDDKRINAVVMAAPFKSKLTYMQCMGRAIRRNEEEPQKDAYVIELAAGSLPNIRYRIDNRWIYSEISDLLEPKIVDETYGKIKSLNGKLEALYKQYKVPEKSRRFANTDGTRVQVLFFKKASDSHECIFIDEENRRATQNWFNFLSTRIASGKLKGVNRTKAMDMVKKWWSNDLKELGKRENIYDAMVNSYPENNPNATWITLVSFRQNLETQEKPYMPDIIPQLKKISVDPFELLLDPNNPRYFSDDDDRVDDEEIGLTSVQRNTLSKMAQYHIRELQDSMLENGYVPTDAIFVTPHTHTGKYLVREGNRRVTAIQGLLTENQDPECSEDLKQSLTNIEVLEVQSNGSEQELEEHISYLLGVRHHGSLKKWSPFARAMNAFNHYLDVSGQTEETFQWDKSAGESVAKSLSVSLSEIETGFKVYRAMKQIDSLPEVKKVNGMQSRFFNLFKEVFGSKRKGLKSYLQQDGHTFLLNTPETTDRMERLCHFTRKDREGAPVKSPKEWIPYNRILEDQDEDARKENIRRVEEDKIKPSIVWADRQTELSRLDWSSWLKKSKLILEAVNAGQLLQEEGTEEYKQAIQALSEIDVITQNLKKTQSDA